VAREPVDQNHDPLRTDADCDAAAGRAAIREEPNGARTRTGALLIGRVQRKLDPGIMTAMRFRALMTEHPAREIDTEDHRSIAGDRGCMRFAQIGGDLPGRALDAKRRRADRHHRHGDYQKQRRDAEGHKHFEKRQATFRQCRSPALDALNVRAV
jgi:hypothetical protein